MNKKSKIILDYVKSQYETEFSVFKSIDSRVGNYLLITSLFWGFLIQFTPRYTKYLLSNYSLVSWDINLSIAFFLIANVFLFTAVFMMLIIFTNMTINIPGVHNKEKYFQVIDSELVGDDDVIKDVIRNYTGAYLENLNNSKARSIHFANIRKIMFIGIVSEVLFIVVYYFIKLLSLT